MLDLIARACHEANRVLQAHFGDPVNPPWDECDSDLQESARIGVEHAAGGATPEQLHESWCATKTAQGWVYGPVKDDTTKTHPCLVPYADLPAEQRLKDAMFGAIVDAYTAA